MIKILYIEKDTLGKTNNKIKRVDLPSELEEWKQAIKRINKKLKYQRYTITNIESAYTLHTN